MLSSSRSRSPSPSTTVGPKSPSASVTFNKSKTPPLPPRSVTSAYSNYSTINKTPPKLLPRTHFQRNQRPRSSRYNSYTNGSSEIRSILKTSSNAEPPPQGYSSPSARLSQSGPNTSSTKKQSARFLYQHNKRRPSNSSKAPSEFNFGSQGKQLSQEQSQWPYYPSYTPTPFQQPFPPQPFQQPPYFPTTGYPIFNHPNPLVAPPGQYQPFSNDGAPPGPFPSTPNISSLQNPTYAPEASNPYDPSSYAPEASDPYNPSSYPPEASDPYDPNNSFEPISAPTAATDASKSKDAESEDEDPCCKLKNKKKCGRKHKLLKDLKLYKDGRDSAYLTTSTAVSGLIPFGKPYKGYKKAIRTVSARCIKWGHIEFRNCAAPGNPCCHCGRLCRPKNDTVRTSNSFLRP